MSERTDAQQAIDYSIVMPVYFNEGELRTTFEGLEREVIAKNPDLTCEIIFVDDGSGDGSLDELLELHEEHPDVVRVIKLALSRKGYQVDVARNGEQALEKLHTRTYDVLITDYQMPRMDGQRLCQVLHEEIPGPKPLTLIITAKTDSGLRDWAEQAAHTEFLEKPLSLRRLTARLDDHFGSESTLEGS